MGRSVFSWMRARVVRRCALSTLAACAALVVVGASPAQAAKKRTNTFSGSCPVMEGLLSFDPPITFVPSDGVMDARLTGECSGTLNGRNIQSAPAVALASVHGVESCGPAVEAGRFQFKIAGRTISGSVIYRRVAVRATVIWQGDGGGQAVIEVHGDVGAVGQDDPLAATPVVGPLISGQVTAEEATRACAGDGISQFPVAADVFNMVPSLSG